MPVFWSWKEKLAVAILLAATAYVGGRHRITSLVMVIEFLAAHALIIACRRWQTARYEQERLRRRLEQARQRSAVDRQS